MRGTTLKQASIQSNPAIGGWSISKNRKTYQPSLDTLFQLIWKIKASPKIQHFLWTCLRSSLPVAGNLAYRHIAKEKECPRCPGLTETTNHLLFTCHYARLIWAISPIPAPPNGQWSDSVYSNLYRALHQCKEQSISEEVERIVPWLLWRLWKHRNKLIFEGVEYNVEDTLWKAQEDADEWANSGEENLQSNTEMAKTKNGM